MESLHFLYRTGPGRIVLKVLTQPSVSEICGRFLDSSLSKCLICPFVKKNQIDLSEYELEQIGSFNDFFSRKIKEDRRSIDRNSEHSDRTMRWIAFCLEDRRRDSASHQTESLYGIFFAAK